MRLSSFLSLIRRRAAAPLGAMIALACGTSSGSGGPQAGTQTNWLRTCDTHAECGLGNACLCGSCTRVVEDDLDVCNELPGASAVASTDPGAIALCGGAAAPVKTMCLTRCDDNSCPEGSSCVAGICAPTATPTITLSVDTSSKFQKLAGFGASIAYTERAIVSHSTKDELYDAMFKNSGLTFFRFRNSYVAGEDTDLSAFKEIYEAAQSHLDEPPTIMLMSASPPSVLKQNSDLFCEGNPDTCTLSKDDTGGFAYEALATHFRESLEAYDAAGIAISYLSIQNDPNYVPPLGAGIETCKFLPNEGVETIVIDGTETEVEYPGYREALDAVLDAISDLPNVPQIAAPEVTGVKSSSDYISAMDLTGIDALAHHMYGIDALDPNEEDLASLSRARERAALPLFQTEMAGEGLETAMLIQQALVDIGSSVYVQTGFVAPAGLSKPDGSALIALNDSGFVLQGPYHAFRHFARYTGIGWQRVSHVTDRQNVRASAWMSPDEEQLTVVIVNPGSAKEVVAFELDENPEKATMVRTVFDGVEGSAELGEVSLDAGIVIPARAMVSLTMQL